MLLPQVPGFLANTFNVGSVVAERSSNTLVAAAAAPAVTLLTYA